MAQVKAIKNMEVISIKQKFLQVKSIEVAEIPS